MNFKFDKERQQNSEDLSRKGSIDSAIKTIVDNINSSENYFTTSSCSGRVLLYSKTDNIAKKGCNWIFVSHEPISFENLVNNLNNHNGTAVLKFESFILHVQCECLPRAQALHCAGIESGFKNSGITVSKKGRITVAIRSAHTMEVPLSKNGELLVSNQYLEFLTEEVNRKMCENSVRIKRFESNVTKILNSSEDASSSYTKIKKRKNGATTSKSNNNTVRIEKELTSDTISLNDFFDDG